MNLSPPWLAPTGKGRLFTVPGIDNVPDLHGDIVDPQLVIFFHGNQFMVTRDLIAAFRRACPEYERIYWETLPPGVLVDQIREGALVTGNLRIAIRPDIFTAGAARIGRLDRECGWFSRMEPYTRNRLGIMVHADNPHDITGLGDLGRPEVRVSMPDPRTEGIGRMVVQAYEKAGGKSLADTVMKEKVENGSTFLTDIHHRQTPMRIMSGDSDAGPVWRTEALFQQRIGNPVGLVEIPPEYNQNATYVAARLKLAPHPRAADEFLDLLTGPGGQAIYRDYGFLPM
jgi:molybdate transport system substrate-binding protein